MDKRLFGWIRQPIDHRDLKFTSSPRFLSALPSKVDLAPNMGQYFNQASEGSCGPNTAAECIEYDQKAEKLTMVAPSRNFIYYNARATMGPQYITQDSGVNNRDLMKSLANFGFCPESMWPYDPNTFTSKPTPACYLAAVVNRISSYASVPQTLDQMKACIAKGFPFIFGFSVYQSMMGDGPAATGIIPDPQPGDSPIGGHDMTLCGYDDNGFGKIPGGAFKLRQHWVNADGTPWGDGGYGYISYNYATGPEASDFWVINAVPAAKAPAPAPVPVPLPAPISSASQISSVIDGEFERLIKLNPMYGSILSQLKIDIDGLISKNFSLVV